MSMQADASSRVAFRDIILYLRLFRESLVPPVELPTLLWGMMPKAEWLSDPVDTISPARAAQTWLDLDVATRISITERLSTIGLSPDAIIRFVGGHDRWVSAALGKPCRRGRPVRARQLFRVPAKAAHANAFLDAFLLQLFGDPSASDVIMGFYRAFRAYSAVVEDDGFRLTVDEAWSVTISAVGDELRSRACYVSRGYYFLHSDFVLDSPPWLTRGVRSLTMADRVCYSLLYYTPVEEHPVFTAAEMTVAIRSMREGSACWDGC
jgi:hypothetical protein